MAVTVLIVDDQERVRRAVRAVVAASHGFEMVAEASTGEVAVEIARRLHPALVLIDVHLPGIDGLETARRILAESEQARPVVLMLSMNGAAQYAAEAEEAGASELIAKSDLSPDRLRAAWDAAQSHTHTRGVRP